jgi:hypothetical protein
MKDAMIIFGRGCCLKCGHPLTIIDMETSFIQLNTNGTPIGEETMIKCEGVCRNCGERYPMMRDYDEYVHDNEYTRFCQEYIHQQFVKQTEKLMDDLKPKPDNPFCLGENEKA